MAGNNCPKVSVIIPSFDGFRDGCVPRLLESIEAQSFRDFDIHQVIGISPQGKAINQGVGESEGEILLILDDDSRLTHNRVFEQLVNALESNPEVGMAGASIVIPPESSDFQRKASSQFPRFNTPAVEVLTDSDLACHGCCAIPRKVFNEIGGEREDIIRGLDPDLRVRLRDRGYRVVLVPEASIYHPLPDGWTKLLRIFFRNGYGSAYAQKFQPDSVYETHESLHSESFKAKRSIGYRFIRYPFRLVKACALFQWMRFGAYVSYALGYGWGLLTAQEIVLSSGSEGGK